VGAESDRDSVALHMLNNTMLGLGLDTLLGPHPGILTFPIEVLSGGQVNVLPTERIVLHVTAPANPDPALLETCRVARRNGFKIALSDTFPSANTALHELASMVVIDFPEVSGDQRRSITSSLSRPDRRVVAKNLATYSDYFEAQADGFDHFQGAFFCEPELFSGRNLNATSHSLARLISEVNRPELDLEALEELIRRDVALSLKLLRYLQSASLGWRHEVSTIGQALRILGQQPTRKWASLVAMTMMPADKPRELFTTSLIRGQFCEEIGGPLLGNARRGELFLVGLLSTLDALLDRPMTMLVTEMALSRDCSAALLGEGSPLTPFLQLSIAYDQGDWPTVDALSSLLGLPEGSLPEAYHRTLAWVGDVMAAE
jgi:EAL and modified HD-GYP domain-containing signal transduction protein